MAVRAIVFDAYGTLYDVQSVRDIAADLCGDSGDLVTHLWRLKQLEYSWLFGLMENYQDFWSVTRAALEFALDSVGISPTSALCEQLMQRYLRLDLYPDARETLLAFSQYKLAILSNGSQTMLDTLVQASGIESLMTAVISVDKARTYKPSPKCYELVDSVLDVPKEDVLFVSSNSFDVAGAKNFGFRVAWIERNASSELPRNSDIGTTELYKILRNGPDKLGLSADFRISALADLPVVVSRLVDGGYAEEYRSELS